MLQVLWLLVLGRKRCRSRDIIHQSILNTRYHLVFMVQKKEAKLRCRHVSFDITCGSLDSLKEADQQMLECSIYFLSEQGHIHELDVHRCHMFLSKGGCCISRGSMLG